MERNGKLGLATVLAAATFSFPLGENRAGASDNFRAVCGSEHVVTEQDETQMGAIAVGLVVPAGYIAVIGSSMIYGRVRRKYGQRN